MESLESKSDRMSEKVDRLLDEVRRKLDDDGGGGGGRDFDTDEEDMFVAEPSIQVTWFQYPFEKRLSIGLSFFVVPWVTPAAEKTKTQGQNSSKKLKE